MNVGRVAGGRASTACSRACALWVRVGGWVWKVGLLVSGRFRSTLLGPEESARTCPFLGWPGLWVGPVLGGVGCSGCPSMSGASCDAGCSGVVGLLFECWIVDASIFVVCCVLVCVFGDKL